MPIDEQLELPVDPAKDGDRLPLEYEPDVGAVDRLRRWLGFTHESFKIGTLSYTRGGLILMFFWLLWGDLVWSIMEKIYPVSMPFQLDRLGIPKQWITWMTLTATSTLGMIMVPIISFRSDRTRTRFGRRIPYILATMVPLCIFLSLLGFTDTYGAWIKHSAWPARLHISTATAIILCVGTLLLLYDVFNVFVNSVYWYLFRDMIPHAYLGRFMAAFAVVKALADWIWQRFFYWRIETNTKQIYIGAAIIYLFGFGLMCFMVKEGQYPPPKEIVRGDPWIKRTADAIATYFTQCFTHPLYLTYYLADTLLFLAGACAAYRQLFLVRHMHFTLLSLSRFNSWMVILGVLLPIPLGWLSDKIHPMRAYLIAVTATAPAYVALYFLGKYYVAGFILNSFTIYMVIMIFQSPFGHLGAVSGIPLNMRLYPKMQYGQFASAASSTRQISNIPASIIAGGFIGLMFKRYKAAGYTEMFAWQASFHILGTIALWVVFIMWHRHGGPDFKYDPENPHAAEGRVRRQGLENDREADREGLKSSLMGYTDRNASTHRTEHRAAHCDCIMRP